jgi:hypothetical protein
MDDARRIDGMTLQSMTRRLDRLGDGPAIGIGEALGAATRRVNRRIKAWHDGGCIGPLSLAATCSRLDDPPPGDGPRVDREMWRKIAEGHARVVFLPNELQAAYAMSDADLWRAVSQREQAAAGAGQ